MNTLRNKFPNLHKLVSHLLAAKWEKAGNKLTTTVLGMQIVIEGVRIAAYIDSELVINEELVVVIPDQCTNVVTYARQSAAEGALANVLKVAG